MKFFERIHIITLSLTLVMVLMLSACSDDMDDSRYTEMLIQIVPYGNTFTDEEAPDTRSATIPEGYTNFVEVYSSSTDAIVIYLRNEEDESISGNFTPSSSKTWTSTVEAEVDTKYYVYGYYPASCTSDVTLTSSNWETGAKLTLKNLSTLSTSDVCVVSGIDNVGNFGFQTSDTGESTISCLLLDHIYSSICLKYKVDADYAELRTIKLTDVKLKLTSAYAEATAEVTLSGTTKSKSISWINEGSTTEVTSGNLVSASGLELGTVFNSINDCFIPATTSSPTFNIVSTYNVYDKKGNLVREGCVATNKNVKLDGPLETGKRNTIQLTVTPTYLYQLSDPDLDNPTIVLE